MLGRTALLHVCSSSCEEAVAIVHCLLDRNANILLQDQDGHTGEWFFLRGGGECP